jgi:hypothetical protein
MNQLSNMKDGHEQECNFQLQKEKEICDNFIKELFEQYSALSNKHLGQMTAVIQHMYTLSCFCSNVIRMLSQEAGIPEEDLLLNLFRVLSNVHELSDKIKLSPKLDAAVYA